jgi:hypothetical protein
MMYFPQQHNYYCLLATGTYVFMVLIHSKLLVEEKEINK